MNATALRPIATLLCSMALGLPVAVLAADAAPAGAKPVAKAASKPSASRQQLNNKAKGLALATTTVQRISDAQLEVANRVLTGTADCEFNQKVSVNSVSGQPGHFKVGFKKATYTMVPEETTTGAVRLEDKKAGVVWLQIPAKSMLMNARIGQRMVDACQHSEQRAATAAVEAAGGASAPAMLRN
ncbi:hypothetical protein [Ideonella sp. A 288]|uniref:hypothetical protein n=1 Tax=Ideonella sp. A 288 TaxID=1962181 RepID=UPI000B4B257A|nr:hypothetical protein [Ideonella sp. A 288]